MEPRLGQGLTAVLRQAVLSPDPVHFPRDCRRRLIAKVLHEGLPTGKSSTAFVHSRFRQVQDDMTTDTRSRFLEVARRHFAGKGFDGTSIAAVAEEMGLTKQALLHHFGSKEKLYGEVLQQISAAVTAQLGEITAATTDPYEALETLLVERIAGELDESDGTRIVIRELLDNKSRARSARTWPLKPYLDGLIAMVKANPSTAHFSDARALAAIYQFMGAVNFLVISEPTLSRMYGERHFDEMKRVYPETLRTLVRATFLDESDG
jgi:AcrR family transcriptional regulator